MSFILDIFYLSAFERGSYSLSDRYFFISLSFSGRVKLILSLHVTKAYSSINGKKMLRLTPNY